MQGSLYEILGVEKKASADDIRRAYRKLARKHHPDVNPGDAVAEETFKKVAAAYDVLSDDKRRAEYDEFGEDSLKGGFDADKARAYQSWQSRRRSSAGPFRQAAQGQRPRPQSGQGYSEFDFADLFGSGWNARGPMRGADAQAVVEMTLRQAIVGGEVEFQMPGRKSMKVRIPPGADTGSTIRLRGKGMPGHDGGEAGDLVIETKVKPHPRVVRRGLDLTVKLPITLAEAFLGADVTVPTFHAPVKLKIPPLSQAGAKLRLRGKGVARGGKSGDLLVELDVRLPSEPDDELAEAIEKNSDAHPSNPRRDFAL